MDGCRFFLLSWLLFVWLFINLRNIVELTQRTRAFISNLSFFYYCGSNCARSASLSLTHTQKHTDTQANKKRAALQINKYEHCRFSSSGHSMAHIYLHIISYISQYILRLRWGNANRSACRLNEYKINSIICVHERAVRTLHSPLRRNDAKVNFMVTTLLNLDCYHYLCARRHNDKHRWSSADLLNTHNIYQQQWCRLQHHRRLTLSFLWPSWTHARAHPGQHNAV